MSFNKSENRKTKKVGMINNKPIKIWEKPSKCQLKAYHIQIYKILLNWGKI